MLSLRFVLRVFELICGGNQTIPSIPQTLVVIDTSPVFVASDVGRSLFLDNDSIPLVYRIYIGAVAGASIILAAIWMLPWSTMIAFQISIFTSYSLCVLWLVSLAFLLAADRSCVFSPRDLVAPMKEACGDWNHARSLSFLSAALWHLSGTKVSHGPLKPFFAFSIKQGNLGCGTEAATYSCG